MIIQSQYAVNITYHTYSISQKKYIASKCKQNKVIEQNISQQL